MKLLIDECLHTSLVALAREYGHECYHVNWLGLSGEKDWNLMTKVIEDEFTFVTNNASDFRKLYARHELHAGLIIIVPQVAPSMQCELLRALLETLRPDTHLVNEVIEITLDGPQVLISHYKLHAPDSST